MTGTIIERRMNRLLLCIVIPNGEPMTDASKNGSGARRVLFTVVILTTSRALSVRTVNHDAMTHA
jgi:hypothetical protein